MEWNKSSQCRSCVCTPAFSKNESQGGGQIGRPLLHTEVKGDGMGMSNQTEEKELFHAVSLSGGKDSTAMLLLMIERGEYDSNAFLKEIQDMISALVQTYEKVKGSDVLMAKEVQTVGVCPVCGSSVTERQKGFFCSKRECHFALWKNSRYFESIGKSLTSAVAQKLLSNGEVIPPYRASGGREEVL